MKKRNSFANFDFFKKEEKKRFCCWMPSSVFIASSLASQSFHRSAIMAAWFYVQSLQLISGSFFDRSFYNKCQLHLGL